MPSLAALAAAASAPTNASDTAPPAPATAPASTSTVPTSSGSNGAAASAPASSATNGVATPIAVPVATPIATPIALDCLPPISTEQLITDYGTNPRLRARPPRAQEVYLEEVLDEKVTVRMLTKESEPVLFTVPDGCNAVDFFISPIELNPGIGKPENLDEVITVGELVIGGDNVGLKLGTWSLWSCRGGMPRGSKLGGGLPPPAHHGPFLFEVERTNQRRRQPARARRAGRLPEARRSTWQPSKTATRQPSTTCCARSGSSETATSARSRRSRSGTSSITSSCGGCEPRYRSRTSGARRRAARGPHTGIAARRAAGSAAHESIKGETPTSTPATSYAQEFSAQAGDAWDWFTSTAREAGDEAKSIGTWLLVGGGLLLGIKVVDLLRERARQERQADGRAINRQLEALANTTVRP